MAQYLHLNIYKKSFDFLVKLTQITSNFQRDFRFTIGEKLNSTTIGFIVLIYKANSAKESERVEYILRLLDELQKITVLTRLATELKNIPRERYMELALMLEDIEKQLNGWKNHSMKEAEKDNIDSTLSC